MESTIEVQLDTMIPGERGTVSRINTVGSALKQRLLEMGLIRGTLVELVRVAPMGDPIEVRVRGYRLSMRRLEAESVIILKATH
ncbi:MAG TPA: FeoA family protein [Bacteroidota bacterium]|nr:FeoA family protein [Bacteroidota bacterium]